MGLRSERSWSMLIHGVRSGRTSIEAIRHRLGDMTGLIIEAALSIEDEKKTKRGGRLEGFKAGAG